MEPTRKLFLEDSYLSVAEGVVVDINEMGGIVLDQTNFYATSGGQPGDIGFFERANGDRIDIATAVYDDKDTKLVIAHVPAEGQKTPNINEKLTLHIDWDRRYKIMRRHTAMHLMCSLISVPVTGGGIGEDDCRMDFILPEVPFTKEEITADLMALVKANHPTSTNWVDEAELDANPGLVRTMSVQPPRGTGSLRLVSIGENDSVDLQPCGGTHVSETAEIGEIHIAKIENKGKQNRRLRLKFGPLPT